MIVCINMLTGFFPFIRKKQEAGGIEMAGKKIRFRRALTLAAALTLVCAVAAAALSYPFTTKTTDSVRMRRSASSGATVLETLEKGENVEVLGETGSWYHVRARGRDGYVQKQYVNTDKSVIVTPAPEEIETVSGYPYTTVTTDKVNLRSARSVRSALIRTIPRGTEISVTGVSGSWAAVTWGKSSGYVKTDYITLKKVVRTRATATPSPVPTLSPEEDAGSYQVLQKGSSGDQVEALQSALIELGFLNGKPDGKFGAGTERAVIAFQKKNGYPDTGVVDANLQAFLYSGKPKNAKGTAVKINTVSPVSWVTMKLGNTGANVKKLQQRLSDLGYMVTPSGTFDGATKVAVLTFQKKMGLSKKDGVAYAETQQALYADTAIRADATPTPKPTPTPTPKPVYKVPTVSVRKGSEGEDARTVQSRLKELGYFTNRVDGKFGALSEVALKKFQEANGLEADGVAGKGTYQVLFSDAALAKGTTPTPAVTVTPTPAPGEASSFWGTIRPGDTGENVAQLQEMLIELGYLKGRADGTYGDKTTEAVKAFQKANGLTADGSAGEATQKALFSGSARKASAAKAEEAEKNGILKQGATGSAVKDLQNLLIRLGYLKGKADGVYGANTYKAVVAFQKANSLKADGVAGEKTLAALQSGSAVSKEGTPTPTAAPAAAAAAASSGTAVSGVRPSASQVRYENWYTSVKSVARSYPYATVYDFGSGISYQIHIFSIGAHADYEPLTASDTAKMLRIFGGNTWNPKAVWVVFSNGSVYLGSTHSYPHGTQHIADNNFAGHSCLHFPRTQEQVEKIGQYATSHQETIDAAWARTQSMK